MDDKARREIDDARRTVERVSRLSDRNETEPQRNSNTLSSERMTKWRADMEKQEREFAEARAQRQAAEDAERDGGAAWRAWVGDQIAAAVLHCTRTLAEALRDELDARDTTLAKMSAHIHRLEAEQCKLVARVIRAELSNDDAHASKVTDLPNPLTRRREGLN